MVFAVFAVVLTFTFAAGALAEIFGVGAEPGVDGGVQALGGHRGAGDGVDLVVHDGFAFGISRGTALDDLEDVGLGEVGLLAHEFRLEGGIVLDLGAPSQYRTL